LSLLVFLVAGMLMIVLSADYFTNGVEWLGFRLGLGDGVSGSLLAALGTALPETLVPLMAFVFAGGHSVQAIGLGAILGAPFMLSTLGFAVIGLGVFWGGRRDEGLRVSKNAMLSDLRFFLAAFGAAVAAAFVPTALHPLIAAALAAAYILHAWRLVRQDSGAAAPQSPAQPLHLYHGTQPPLPAVFGQVALALFGLIVGAHFFVSALGEVTGWVRISGFLVSVIVTPLATELPEVLNSVIWLKRRRDTLAVGNVTGAMAFQASLVPAIGLVLTDWHFTGWEIVTAVLAWTAALWTLLRSRDGTLHISELLIAGLFYVLFIGLVLAVL
jgi:cation:H+ antiporter